MIPTNNQDIEYILVKINRSMMKEFMLYMVLNGHEHGHDWGYATPLLTDQTYWFRDPKIAMLIKLKYSGQF